MDRDQYISEAERQLNDNSYYQLLDHDPTTEFAIQVADTVNKMHDKGYITEKNMEYLLVKNQEQVISATQNTQIWEPWAPYCFC